MVIVAIEISNCSYDNVGKIIFQLCSIDSVPITSPSSLNFVKDVRINHQRIRIR